MSAEDSTMPAETAPEAQPEVIVIEQPPPPPAPAPPPEPAVVIVEQPEQPAPGPSRAPTRAPTMPPAMPPAMPPVPAYVPEPLPPPEQQALAPVPPPRTATIPMPPDVAVQVGNQSMTIDKKKHHHKGKVTPLELLGWESRSVTIDCPWCSDVTETIAKSKPSGMTWLGGLLACLVCAPAGLIPFCAKWRYENEHKCSVCMNRVFRHGEAVPVEKTQVKSRHK